MGQAEACRISSRKFAEPRARGKEDGRSEGSRWDELEWASTLTTLQRRAAGFCCRRYEDYRWAPGRGTNGSGDSSVITQLQQQDAAAYMTCILRATGRGRGRDGVEAETGWRQEQRSEVLRLWRAISSNNVPLCWVNSARHIYMRCAIGQRDGHLSSANAVEKHWRYQGYFIRIHISKNAEAGQRGAGAFLSLCIPVLVWDMASLEPPTAWLVASIVTTPHRSQATVASGATAPTNFRKWTCSTEVSQYTGMPS
ncbi:hypothetical protein BDZ91DRAFT_782277 [Kalaharituber pfeilii]|nr:hypothetical protein BDZ91DRAFT_782277 [Kalaharituber pfeilii]